MRDKEKKKRVGYHIYRHGLVTVLGWEAPDYAQPTDLKVRPLTIRLPCKEFSLSSTSLEHEISLVQ